MTRALLVAMLFAIQSSALAGKVYRCPDGSYQDKPCGQGERVVTQNNRQATPPPGADRACFDRGREAWRLAKLREGDIPIEKVVDGIEHSGKPYQQQLEEKAFAVKVYQTKGSAVEIKTIFESECVTERQKEAAKATPAPVAATSEHKAAPVETAQSEDKEKSRLCKQLKLDKKANVSKARAGGSGDELEELTDQRKMIEEQLREFCS